MLTKQIEASVTDKVGHWKNAFKTAVEATAECVLPDAEILTYADILKSGGAHITSDWLDQTITRAGATLDGFNQNELNFMQSSGYLNVVVGAQDIFSAYDRRNFELQAEQDGPVIAAPKDRQRDKRLGFIFHALPNLCLLEAFYETGHPKLPSLPDIFVYEGGHFYTVKAIRSLRDHPVLGPRTAELGL